MGRNFDLEVNEITSEEGAVFTPWTDGWAVGFKVTAPDKPTRYVYLNPSGGCDTEDIDDSDVFLYHGDRGDSSQDGSICYVNIWNWYETDYAETDPADLHFRPNPQYMPLPYLTSGEE